jgi:hypothetical protein
LADRERWCVHEARLMREIAQREHDDLVMASPGLQRNP